jgi:predicted ester cyclase
MTAAENRALVYRVYDAINARDTAAMAELFAPHCISHALEGKNVKEGLNMLDQISTVFPDMRFVVEDVLVEGDRAALRVTIHGVPQQPLPIIMEMFRIENGQVAEVWGAGTLHLPDA